MRFQRAVLIQLTISMAALAASPVLALSFQDRVLAEKAIQKVYHAHTIGTCRSFDDAMPHDLLEQRVRLYLERSQVLERIWNQPVTADSLRREAERIARETRDPQRLRELFAALDDDPVLIQECLARPVLVERLIRNLYASDRALHAEARADAERVRDALVRGIDIASSVGIEKVTAELIRSERGARPEKLFEEASATRFLGPEAFAEAKAKFPATAGTVGPVVNERDGFVVRVLLEEQPGRVGVATYVSRKVRFDEWWRTVRPTLDARTVPAASGLDTRPIPIGPGQAGPRSVTGSSGNPGEFDWDNGVLGATAGYTDVSVWTGTEMIVWGGRDFETPRNTGFRYDPALGTVTAMSTANAPEARSLATAVWAGTEMIVWGGLDAEEAALNTGGRYDPAADEWVATAVDPSNPAKYGHTAVWTGTEMIVWGGHDGNGVVAAGYAYDPSSNSWDAVSSVAEPVARWLHTAIWTGDLMIVWGGQDGTGTKFGGGARYNPDTDGWTGVTEPGAAPRSSHSAVWTGTEMIVWGGVDAGGRTDTGARYNPATQQWVSTSTTSGPSARSDHSAIWTGDKMVIWGGRQQSGGSGTNEGGSYAPLSNTWSGTPVNSGTPQARYRHQAVWTGTEMLVYGGYPFSMDGGRWVPGSSYWSGFSVGLELPKLDFHSPVWTGNVLLSWGKAYPPALTAGWKYDPTLETWNPIQTALGPIAGSGHSAVWTGDEMIVWGGADPESGNGLDEGRRYNPLTDWWAVMTSLGAPEPRLYHSAVWTDDRMLVWGGITWNIYDPLCDPPANNTGGVYDPVLNQWTPMAATDLEPRLGHSAVWTGDEMLIWGGRAPSPCPGDEFVPIAHKGAKFDPDVNAWTPINPVGNPGIWEGSPAVWSGVELVVWGEDVHRGGRYDPGTDSWSLVETAGAPVDADCLVGVWSGQEMLVWGIDENDEDAADGARYRPTTDSWAPLPTGSEAPWPDCNSADPAGPKSTHTATWIGDAMVVLGAGNPFRFPNAGRLVPSGVDGDLDGILDAVDNCVATSNSNQLDGDADASGDVCDTCPAVVNVDQADDDEDGAGDVCDCAPGDPSRQGPSEVGPVAASDPGPGGVRLAWPTVLDADWYAVTRALVSTLSDGEYGSCLDDHVATTQIDDYDVPSSGEGYAYLVHGVGATCGSGTLGSSSSGTERTNVNPGACP